MMDTIYATAEAMIRGRLAARRRDFVERCVILALWILRQHGPHGFREFPLDRRALGRSKTFQRGVVIDGEECRVPLLTENQIRSATKALVEIGVIVMALAPRRKNPFRWYADVYVIGMEFADLFPKTKRSAPQARPTDAVRSTPTPNPPVTKSPVNERVIIDTPLVRVTSGSRLPRPYQRRPKPKTKEDLHEACLEALRIRMSSKPVALSQEAMRSVLDPRYRFGSPRQPAPVVGGSQEEACHPQPLEPCRMLLSASARAADGTKCGRRPKERRENATPRSTSVLR
jgi:hypothetical protein